MAEFVDVYSRATGRKYRVPAHYLDNPVLSQQFRKTPKASAAAAPVETTAPSATGAVPTAPAVPAPTTETPAAGDKE